MFDPTPVTQLAPITVAVTDAAAAPSPALLAVLAGEALPAQVLGLAEVLAAAPGACEVLLLWSARGLDPASCARLVAWARARQPPTGLVAWAELGDRLAAEVALAAGFDDAQAGPCSPRELAVRLRALQRRVRRAVHVDPARPAGRLRFRDLVLDPESCELWLDGRAVALTVTELTVLVALLRAQGAVLSRAELLDHAWGGDHLDVGERAVDNVVLRLRRKLGRPALIQTVRGVGFRLDHEAKADGGSAPEALPQP